MGIKDVEDRFLRAIDRSHFLYVYCPEGYIGASTAFEMGYALCGETAIYASDTPDFMELADGDLERKTFLESSIVIAGIAQIAQIERAKQEIKTPQSRGV